MVIGRCGPPDGAVGRRLRSGRWAIGGGSNAAPGGWAGGTERSATAAAVSAGSDRAQIGVVDRRAGGDPQADGLRDAGR